MQHCTPEQLALAALREPLPAPEATHVDGCAECRAEVAGLRRSVDLLSVPAFAAPGGPVAPPPSVWASIAAATGVQSAPRPEMVVGAEATADAAPAASAPRPLTPVSAPVPPTPPVASGSPVTQVSPVSPPPAAAAPGADVVPLRPRRPRPWLLAVAAAVVGALVGGGTIAALQDRAGEGSPVAAAALDPLEDADASGSARVVEREDGTRVLEVDLDAPALSGAYYEVWLLRPDVSGLVPVGTTQAGTSQFEIPAGLDLGDFPVVDVSVEPLDGDPAHSGDSVVRGVLDT